MRVSVDAKYLFLAIVGLCSGIGYYAWQSQMPRVSIITSMYNADEYIDGFLKDITRQTIFNQCELILINANSPGNEEPIIKKYVEKYPNIRYKRLEKDPGIYGVWNECVRMARAPYITNYNVDDRFTPNALEVHVAEIERNADIDLVYADRFESSEKNQTFESDLSKHKYIASREFSPENMLFCLPGNSPMWRKSLHDKHGMFNESYKVSGDWEMWLRAVEGGAEFKRIPGAYGIYYRNPDGLSTGRNVKLATKEAWQVYHHYQPIFAWNQ